MLQVPPVRCTFWCRTEFPGDGRGRGSQRAQEALDALPRSPTPSQGWQLHRVSSPCSLTLLLRSEDSGGTSLDWSVQSREVQRGQVLALVVLPSRGRGGWHVHPSSSSLHPGAPRPGLRGAMSSAGILGPHYLFSLILNLFGARDSVKNQILFLRAPTPKITRTPLSIKFQGGCGQFKVHFFGGGDWKFFSQIPKEV